MIALAIVTFLAAFAGGCISAGFARFIDGKGWVHNSGRWAFVGALLTGGALSLSALFIGAGEFLVTVLTALCAWQLGASIWDAAGGRSDIIRRDR